MAVTPTQSLDVRDTGRELDGRRGYGRIPEVLAVPNLTHVQRDSFQCASHHQPSYDYLCAWLVGRGADGRLNAMYSPE